MAERLDNWVEQGKSLVVISIDWLTLLKTGFILGTCRYSGIYLWLNYNHGVMRVMK